MSRNYEQLGCGCLISCDGGGGLISACPYTDAENCKVKEHIKKHNIWCGGYCKVCHPFKFEDAYKKGEKVYKD